MAGKWTIRNAQSADPACARKHLTSCFGMAKTCFNFRPAVRRRCCSFGRSPAPGFRAHAFLAGEADRALDPLQQFLAERRRHQDAGLELQHARVKGREDRPDAVLVEMLHHRLGAGPCGAAGAGRGIQRRLTRRNFSSLGGTRRHTKMCGTNRNGIRTLTTNRCR